MNYLPIAPILLWATWLAGCPSECPALAQPEAASPASATELTATLAGPTDIDLRWKSQAAEVAAYLVEFTTKPPGHYTILPVFLYRGSTNALQSTPRAAANAATVLIRKSTFFPCSI
jgi:hypothetical protein